MTATGITVRVPLTIRRRDGRKLVFTPGGNAPDSAPTRTLAEPALVRAPARAHRCKRLLEEGRYASLSELAAAERIGRDYPGRILQLTRLASDIGDDPGRVAARGAPAASADCALVD
jgi:hypothetical protein